MGNPAWKPGVSGNPGGRKSSRGLSELIKERTGARGERLVELLRQVMEGDLAFTNAQQRAVDKLMRRDPTRVPELILLIEKLNMPSIKERMEALKLLMEQGHGKPREEVALTDETMDGKIQIAAFDTSKYSPEEKEQLIRLLEKGNGPETVHARDLVVEASPARTAGERVVGLSEDIPDLSTLALIPRPFCDYGCERGSVLFTCPKHGNPEAIP